MMQTPRISEANTTEGLSSNEGIELLESDFCQRTALDAMQAVYALWDSKLHTFWRSTAHRNRDESSTRSPAFFPTVSFRCMDSLLALLLWYPEWVPRDIKDMVLHECVPSVVNHSHLSLKSTLDMSLAKKKKEINIFTLSLYIHAFAGIAKNAHLFESDSLTARIELNKALSTFFTHSITSELLKTGRTNIHPFLLYHIFRALNAAMDLLDSRTKIDKAKRLIKGVVESACESVADLLSKYRLKSLNPNESVALAFCASIIASSEIDNGHQYVWAALEACFQSQASEGCWSFGRVVYPQKDITSSMIEIPTYEISWAISEALIELQKKNSESLLSDPARQAIERLIAAGRYAQRSVIYLDDPRVPRQGWCSDHAYGLHMIESWTSAAVLQSSLRLNYLIEQFNSERTLRLFPYVCPTDRNWPKWLRWDKYLISGEVDHDRPILTYLNKRIVETIKANPRKLPDPEERTTSVLLFGPPGTAKTSIVKGIADALGWPVVTLSPGTFIVHGLEFIEAQSNMVFSRLGRLSKAVVIFDECDELFRERTPTAELEQARGITAFVTASMLPKLQELHDRGRILFFICTNKYESLDSAIKRGGRIDHVIAVGPPDREARRKIILELKTKVPLGLGVGRSHALSKIAIEELATRTERFTRKEIERAALLVFTQDLHSRADVAKAVDVTVNKFQDSLTITESELESFNKDKVKYSYPITEGA